MKKIILISITLIFSLFVNGQRMLSIGPEMSFARTNLLPNHSFGIHKNILGGTYGIGVNYQLKDKWNVLSGVFYEQKGAYNKLYLPRPLEKVQMSTYYYNLEYVQVPVLFRILTKGQIKLFANAGAYMAFLLSHEYSQISVWNTALNTTQDIAHQTNSIDVGLLVGIGAVINPNLFKRFSLSFEVRDNFGLVPIENKEHPGNLKSFNNSLGLQMGLYYSLN